MCQKERKVPNNNNNNNDDEGDKVSLHSSRDQLALSVVDILDARSVTQMRPSDLWIGSPHVAQGSDLG